MNNLDYARGGNFCLVSAGLAEGTNANTIKTAAAIDYCIDGIIYEKAITDNIAVTAGTTQAVLTTCLYTISVDSAGAVTVTQGDSVLSADLADKGLEWPSPPADNCVIGGLKIALANAATFTPGSTDLGATDVTDTFYDFFSLPTTRIVA
jgi:hypothetical protein